MSVTAFVAREILDLIIQACQPSYFVRIELSVRPDVSCFQYGPRNAVTYKKAKSGGIMRVGFTIAMAAFAAAFGSFGSSCQAQDQFPARTVSIIVPIAPGSATDIVARLVGDQLSLIWKQPVVVQNVSGGGQNIGASRVAQSAPDGYTLLVSPPPALTVNHLLYKQITYQPDQFVPVALLAQVPNALIVRKDFPADSVQQLIAYAKANPGKVTFGSQGAGSTAHLTASRLEALTGIKLTHVPYRGELPVLNDMVAGTVDMFFGTLSTVLPLYRDGRLKILAVAQDGRASVAPEIPTMAEAGIKDFHSSAWYAMVAPPNTDPALIAKINKDVNAILKDSQIAGKMKQMFLQPMGGEPQDAERFIVSETKLWSGVLRNAGIQMQ